MPGLHGSGPTHWQTLWEHQYRLERVEQGDWNNPDVVAWSETLDSAIRAQPGKVVIIAHSLGCWTVIHWAVLHLDSSDRVQSALLVAPPELVSGAALPKSALDFSGSRRKKLPFPSILVGSENDPYMSLSGAQALAGSMGSRFINAGCVGHINIGSGHGHWPEGEKLMQYLIRDTAINPGHPDDGPI